MSRKNLTFVNGILKCHLTILLHIWMYNACFLHNLSYRQYVLNIFSSSCMVFLHIVKGLQYHGVLWHLQIVQGAMNVNKYLKTLTSKQSVPLSWIINYQCIVVSCRHTCIIVNPEKYHLTLNKKTRCSTNTWNAKRLL